MSRARALFALAGVSWLASAPAAAQAIGGGHAPDIGWWRIAGALALCLVLAGGAALALRRRAGAGRPLFQARALRLELCESLRVSSHATLALVRCDERELLVLVSSHGQSLIELPRKPPDGALR